MPTLKEYADWAANEVLKESPTNLTADWGLTRTEAIALIGRRGIFETLSLCCALCEFLGTLYRGTKGNSGYQDFQAFIDEFFPEQYRKIHDISGQAGTSSEFYTMFRSKILHGGTPAAVSLPGNARVSAWCIGWDIRHKHLQVINGNLHVDGELFRTDSALQGRTVQSEELITRSSTIRGLRFGLSGAGSGMG